MRILVISGAELDSVKAKANTLSFSLQRVGLPEDAYLTGLVPEGGQEHEFIHWLRQYSLAEWAIVDMAFDLRPNLVDDSGAVLQH